MPRTEIPAAGEAMPAADIDLNTVSANPYEAGPFRQVSYMESPLAAVGDLLKGLALIAETMDDDHSGVVQRMAWLAIDQCNVAEKLRGELFRLTHPRRDYFEKEGWPA
ncbi:hypothetical protein [Mesorhizobium sp. KR1-2]|uniref:hypothetical protein n=1 Tax=Mesorhizobium sp. KR1-2 TaxID=3156609 RepID=UPI0032B4D187